jgi:hypothetical protein
MNVIAFSGGKDSTALALEMHARGESFILFHTPTADEPPGVKEHVERVSSMTGADIVFPEAPTLYALINWYKAIPNYHQRWCTRQIKIEPCIEWWKNHNDCTMLVGLRADEEERRGLYGDVVKQRHPLREWEWGLREVRARVECMDIPRRTDCGLCFFQKISEWQRLWLDHPYHFALGEDLEEWTGYTFRTPGRDTWPTALKDLRADFERGREPKDSARQLDMFSDKCRVCSM